MKARYDKTFEYGKKIAKYLLVFAIIVCLASLFITPEGSYAQLILIFTAIALMIATVVVMYRFCRCPYCGKRIMLGVLKVTSCPACHRSLSTGKKTKR